MKPRVLFNRKDGHALLPIAFSSAIRVCAPVFSRPVWQHVKVLMTGAVLAPGQQNGYCDSPHEGVAELWICYSLEEETHQAE